MSEWGRLRENVVFFGVALLLVGLFIAVVQFLRWCF
jgi:hypothetical protein